MKTEKFYLKDRCADIAAVGDILKNGGIVAIPTETVYGLAASAYSDSAIEKVFLAKGRPQDNPLIVHISDMEMLKDVAADIPEVAYKLAEKFWPGPLTMVLGKGDKVCESVSRGLNTVAVTMPSHKTALEKKKTAGLPLAAPSANTSGYPSPTSASHVLHDLDGKIGGVVMDENCEVGVESTVVSLVGNTPRLLRPGAVTLEQLREILPDICMDSAVLTEVKKGEKVSSPGMKYKHYSPKTKVFLVEGSNKAFTDYVNQTRNSAAICFLEDLGIKIPFTVYGTAENPATLAHNVFEALRDIDDKGYNAVYVHAPEKTGVGLAVYNRLIRAAAFKVITL